MYDQSIYNSTKIGDSFIVVTTMKNRVDIAYNTKFFDFDIPKGDNDDWRYGYWKEYLNEE